MLVRLDQLRDISINNSNNCCTTDTKTCNCSSTDIEKLVTNYLTSYPPFTIYKDSTLTGLGTISSPLSVVSSGSTFQRVFSNNADIKYSVISGTPIVTFTSVSGVGTIVVSGGTIELDRVQIKTGSGGNTWDGSSMYTVIAPTVNSGTFIQYPLVNIINTNSNSTPSGGSPHIVRNPGSTPVVTFTAATAGTSITMLTGDLSILGPSAIIVMKF